MTKLDCIGNFTSIESLDDGQNIT